MKIPVQYVSDAQGNPQAVLVPLSEWERILNKLKKYEQTLKIRSDLKEAFDEIKAMKSGRIPEQTLSDFLNDL